MPKVILTQKQREAQVVEREVQLACQTLLTALGEKQWREGKQHLQIAAEIGLSRNAYCQWRNGKLPEAGFGRVLTAWAKLGYRLVPEPIAGRSQNRRALEWGDQPVLNRGA